jgi:NAD(P)-dependent dehydrogenase (short-subunit alcohol dehydrogenase family)
VIRHPFEAISLPCNIAHKEQLQKLVDATMKQWGKIDILVCNAAANPVYGPTAQAGDEAFDKIMGNNIKSNWWLCNMVIPQMAERRDGAVIIVSSIAALKGNTVIGLYGVSKAADTALVRNYACEWGPSNIRVNAILPGLIKTDFARALWENDKRARRAGDDAAKAPGRARGNRRHRRVPRLQGRQFHHRPDHRRRRRVTIA